jgi:hypothetical protein
VPGHLGHLLVGDDDGDVLLLEDGERLLGVGARDDPVMLALQGQPEGVEDDRLIVDDEDRGAGAAVSFMTITGLGWGRPWRDGPSRACGRGRAGAHASTGDLKLTDRHAWENGPAIGGYACTDRVIGRFPLE